MKKLSYILVILILFGIINSEDCKCQWVQSNGIYGGSVFSLATSENKTFAGTNNGVYLSTNNRQIWTQTALNNETVTSLVISGNNIFAVTTYYTSFCDIWLSTNNGTNWSQTVLNDQSFSSLVVTGNNIFAG